MTNPIIPPMSSGASGGLAWSSTVSL
jgi:hypothetical protein